MSFCPQGGGGACSKFPGGAWSGTPPLWQAPPPGRPPPWQAPPLAGTPPAGTPPWQAPPPGYGQSSAGTHPTGMHSCYVMTFSSVYGKHCSCNCRDICGNQNGSRLSDEWEATNSPCRLFLAFIELTNQGT